MSQDFDADGQPETQGFNWARRRERGFDELVGLCRGILADGVVVIEEVEFLYKWLQRNEPVRLTYLGNALMKALTLILADGKMDHQEEDMLVDLLMKAVGGTTLAAEDCSYSSQLPLDSPPPKIEIRDRSFCFTGKFAFGTRQQCELAVVDRGGLIHKHPKTQTSFLVVGDVGSRDWIHSISGRKIEHAMLLKKDGKRIYIVSEPHWVTAISECVARYATNVSGYSADVSEPQESIDPIHDAESRPLAGQTIVVTGTMEKLGRSEIEDLIVKLGGKASGSVSKKTNFVVAGESAGSKLDKAKELGVEVLTEAQFLKKIGKA